MSSLVPHVNGVPLALRASLVRRDIIMLPHEATLVAPTLLALAFHLGRVALQREVELAKREAAEAAA